MRPRVVFTVLAFAFSLIGFSLYLSRDTRDRTPSRSADGAATHLVGDAVSSPPTTPASSTDKSLETSSLSLAPAGPVSPGGSVGAATQAVVAATKPVVASARSERAGRATYIQSRVVALRELAMQSDTASLEIILSELTNPEKEIRAEALEATIQFGSSNAIPRIKEIAATIEDPREKVELLDAADFLELPSIKELRSKLRQKKASQQTP